MCKSTIKPPLARTWQTVPATYEPYLGVMLVLYGQERGLRLSDSQLELEEMLSVAPWYPDTQSFPPQALPAFPLAHPLPTSWSGPVPGSPSDWRSHVPYPL